MWTYLILFLAICVLLGIFGRRIYLLYRKGAKVKVPEKKEVAESESLEKKDKLSPKDKLRVSDYYQKGEQLLQSGKEEDAIKSFVQALALDSAHLDTLQNLAMLYMNKQMFSAAAALFKQLSELSNDPVHFSHLGLAHYQQQEFEEATTAYQRAIELDPSRPQRFVSLAQVYRAKGEPQLAIIAVNKALEQEQENLDFLFLLAELFVEKNDLDSAGEVLGKILELSPKNNDALKALKELEKMKEEQEGKNSA